MAAVMEARDAVFAALAECYITIDDERLNFMQAISLQATVTKTKVTVPILGKTGRGNKATGWKGTGSARFHYNSSRLRKLMLDYKDSGEDMYFDIQVTSEDPTANVGRQTVILKDVNLDNVLLTAFDADGDYLTEEISFTFEDFEIPEEFEDLDGML